MSNDRVYLTTSHYRHHSTKTLADTLAEASRTDWTPFDVYEIDLTRPDRPSIRLVASRSKGDPPPVTVETPRDAHTVTS